MSVSVREQALAAVMAVLGAAGSPSRSVTREQLEQIEQVDLPCFDVAPDQAKAGEALEGTDRNAIGRSQAFTVRAIVDATGTTSLALDPLYVWALQQLTGGAANLGGAVIGVEETGDAHVFRPAGRNILGLEMHFEMTFATRRGDPTQKG